jgi:hypothetical protein
MKRAIGMKTNSVFLPVVLVVVAVEVAGKVAVAEYLQTGYLQLGHLHAESLPLEVRTHQLLTMMFFLPFFLMIRLPPPPPAQVLLNQKLGPKIIFIPAEELAADAEEAEEC